MFKEAKLRLTALYLLVIMIISISFSAVMYTGVSNATKRALDNQRVKFERRMMELPPSVRMVRILDDSALVEIRERTLSILIFVNIIIFVGAGGLGYYLAGRTLEPIEIMLTKQKKFISDAAHELKTPLTAMKTDLEVTLRDKNLSLDKSKDALTASVTEIDQLTSFINSLLKKSKFQTQQASLSIEKLNLADIAQEVVTKLESLAHSKEQVIKSDLMETEVKADYFQMVELVTNLVDNAIKYNKQSGVVHVTVKPSGNYAYLEVTDEGEGIPEEELTNIFEPFYKVEKSRTKTNNEGFGLGLSIVKEIVDSLTGSIDIQSTGGKGTKFIVRLPLSQQHLRILT